ncbi:MAG: MATE family efflux transporter [Oscillospiraceae bacterium]|nr:MATE family efflux transporter [Oscillospiraceae bacterium]
MLRGPLLRNIVFYTIPIILTSVLQLLFMAADLVVVGRYCGSISVAAVGATNALTALIVNLFMGLSIGAGVTVAHSIGGHRDEETHRIVHTSLPTAAIGGFVLAVIGITFCKQLLIMMGTPETVLPLSASYMKIFFAGMPFAMVYNFCASILRAAGDTKSPLIFLSLAGGINVLLNLLFVTVFQMNVAGVALATIISQGISAVLMIIVLMRRTDACKLYLSKMHIYKQQLLKIIRIGLPAGIQGSIFSISNVIIQSSVNSFGDIFMSGNASAQSIEAFVYVTINSFQQTAVNFVGQNVGANQYDRVSKISKICLASVAITGIVVGGTTFFFGPSLLSIYITDSPEAIAYGIMRMTFVCLPYFLCGLMDVSTGLLRGLGASVAPMIISILGVCGIRIMWIFTIFQMPEYHSPQSLYASYPISWTLTFLVQLVVFIFIYRKQANESALN